ncbi:MAG TPA: hypothetical protein VFK89_04345 [Actinomycetota bacterium]|nr:hypothetical protein [Actinomycetota bacterium]
MNPTVKKILTGLAVTKGIEKIQEMRAPRKSFLRRNFGKLLFVGAAGGAAAYMYRTGKLTELMGGKPQDDYREQYPVGPGTQPIPSSDRELEPSGV